VVMNRQATINIGTTTSETNTAAATTAVENRSEKQRAEEELTQKRRRAAWTACAGDCSAGRRCANSIIRPCEHAADACASYSFVLQARSATWPMESRLS
jgi:hypothetical protein